MSRQDREEASPREKPQASQVTPLPNLEAILLLLQLWQRRPVPWTRVHVASLSPQRKVDFKFRGQSLSPSPDPSMFAVVRAPVSAPVPPSPSLPSQHPEHSGDNALNGGGVPGPLFGMAAASHSFPCSSLPIGVLTSHIEAWQAVSAPGSFLQSVGDTHNSKRLQPPVQSETSSFQRSPLLSNRREPRGNVFPSVQRGECMFP